MTTRVKVLLWTILFIVGVILGRFALGPALR
jgi:hypothetical protein